MALKIILITLASMIALAMLTYAYLVYWRKKLPKIKADGIRVACIGDSITQGIGVMFNHPGKNSYPALLQGMLGSHYQVLNYGHSGRTLLDSGDMPYRKSRFFTSSLKSNPAIVLIMLGTNDSKSQNWNAVKYERQLVELVELYQNLSSRPAVYLLIPPAAFLSKGKKEVAFKTNAGVIEKEIVPIVHRVGARMNKPIIDIFSATKNHPEHFPDGVHPNAEGDKVIAQTVYLTLTKARL